MRESVAGDRRLNRILHIRRVDLVTCSHCTIHREVQVRLSEDTKQPKILNPAHCAHDADNFVTLLLQRFQIIAINLDG